jgi:hypothetical protein
MPFFVIPRLIKTHNSSISRDGYSATKGFVMTTAESVLVRGNNLHERVDSISSTFDAQLAPQSRLLLSFDLYCVLLEYTALVGQLNLSRGQSIEELLSYDELIFDTGLHKLTVSVDFFGPADSLQIC